MSPAMYPALFVAGGGRGTNGSINVQNEEEQK